MLNAYPYIRVQTYQYRNDTGVRWVWYALDECLSLYGGVLGLTRSRIVIDLFFERGHYHSYGWERTNSERHQTGRLAPYVTRKVSAKANASRIGEQYNDLKTPRVDLTRKQI